MAMVFVFPLMTVVMARNSVVKANISPMASIITPIISLAKSFILNDICVIDEKQNEAKTMKNTRAFFDFRVFLFKSSTKGNSLFFSALWFGVLEAVCRLSFKSSSTGFFNLCQA